MAATRKENPKRVRRTYQEIFLDALTELSKNGEQTVSSQQLQDKLCWNEPSPYPLYKRIKGELVLQRKIKIGVGRGGPVELVLSGNEAPPKSLRVFLSYSHQDEELKKELMKHLSPLKRLNLVHTWHDGRINAGDKWDDKIMDNLQTADIIIPLVSIDFINSDYCYVVEMDIALERARKEEAVVIPVIGRNCMWKTTKFSSLQAVPTDGKAIMSWHDRDEALTVVAESIREVAQRLLREQ